ncbi:MAG: HEAT repeat domain-containing protein [bacterium]|nr:HEAT repeat domain-containing protein [bacterium]
MITFILFILLGADDSAKTKIPIPNPDKVVSTDNSKILLNEQQIEDTKKTYHIDKGLTEIPAGDLRKKDYAIEAALEKFGGSQEERIRLEKSDLDIKFRKVAPSQASLPSLKELPEKMVRKFEKVPDKRDTVNIPIKTLEKLLIAQGEKIPLDIGPMSLADSAQRAKSMKFLAINTLTEIKEPGIMDILRTTVEKGSEEEKLAAAEVLAKKGDTLGLKTLTKELKREELEPRVEAIKSIGKVKNPTSIPVLQELLSDKESAISIEAAFALAGAKDKKGIAEVHKLLNSENTDIKLRAAYELANIGDTASIPVLKTALNHSSSKIRYKAARALGETGDKSMVPVLNKLMKEDSDYKVRLAATESILRLQKEGQKEALK